MLHLIVIGLLGLTAPAFALDDEPAYRLVVLGDSLSAGFGLSDNEALPARLDQALAARGLAQVIVLNAGVSGDTTAGGLARFDFSVGPDADGVVIALGANDALQGQPPARTRANLAAMIDLARARNLDIVLAGMQAPVNMGVEYRAQFDAIYPDLSQAEDIALYPFLLGPVILRPELLQRDGLHPTAEGVELMAAPLADFIATALFGLPLREVTP
ncbi:arylesterase [Maricaulis salignorans]|uniref:arylesterase n=1 Tax=Maricaulis salignorans TaxID=144026 RepID=UPI003A8E1609